ncbi:uncharacterized protein LOC123710253 [Pieris brassicae]|uniref:Protein sleepless n=1 Tax=Pieris brassicae TaxID=7116 RepID=A0A9P0T8M5_PIEBR|nr:uncharacterized protein LOC123710253 [Pieris brassicae]CAH4027721.1 unnamed protein product [Pieris brassicae]
MELKLYYLVFTFYWNISSAMRCYVCVPEETYEGIKLCENFDYGDQFLRECEHSNMCFKRETSLDLGNGMPTRSITRGCAAQTLSGDQEKVNGKWRHKDTIYDVYAEGCAEDPNNIDRPTRTVNCYCRGNLCNNSLRNQIGLIILLPIVFLIS